MHKAFNVVNSTDILTPVKTSLPAKTLTLSPILFFDTQSLTLVHHISKVNQSLGFLNNHYTITPTNHTSHKPLLNRMYSLMPDVVSNVTSSNVRFQVKEVNNQTILYTLTSSVQEN